MADISNVCFCKQIALLSEKVGVKLSHVNPEKTLDVGLNSRDDY